MEENLGVPNWKKWVNFQSEYKNSTDRLNRLRVYFWYVDARGRLWRKELGQRELFGQYKEPKTVDYMLSSLQINSFDFFSKEYPFYSQYTYQHNFFKAEITPIVYHHLTSSPTSTPIGSGVSLDDSIKSSSTLEYLTFGYEKYVLFEPEKLVCKTKDEELLLFHPFPNDPNINGLIETSLCTKVLKDCEFHSDSILTLSYKNKSYDIKIDKTE